MLFDHGFTAQTWAPTWCSMTAFMVLPRPWHRQKRPWLEKGRSFIATPS